MRKCGEIPPHLFEGEGGIATRLPGAAKPNVVVRSRRIAVQDQRERPSVRPIVPIATAKEDAVRLRIFIGIKLSYSLSRVTRANRG